MKKLFHYTIFLTLLFSLGTDLEAAWTFKNGRLVDADEVATLPVQEHFKIGTEAMEQCNWKEAARHFKIVSVNFSTSPFGQDASYYLGICNYNMGEYDFANDAFSHYLKIQTNPKFFQDSIEYKLAIANHFRHGAKRHFFGTKQLPKWASGKTLAVKIYDEVIFALPSHEIAAKALYAKGCLLWELNEYRDSIDAFQLIIKRFPKHELAPESYVKIMKIYRDQCQYEFQNPDILAFAQINLRRFKLQFPGEERLCEAENDVLEIKEIYAKGLYETGQFYERICKPQASVIYYRSAVKQFPETSIAQLCIDRLNCLKSFVSSIEVKKESV